MGDPVLVPADMYGMPFCTSLLQLTCFRGVGLLFRCFGTSCRVLVALSQRVFLVALSQRVFLVALSKRVSGRQVTR
jgi:hypothetical protein